MVSEIPPQDKFEAPIPHTISDTTRSENGLVREYKCSKIGPCASSDELHRHYKGCIDHKETHVESSNNFSWPIAIVKVSSVQSWPDVFSSLRNNNAENLVRIHFPCHSNLVQPVFTTFEQPYFARNRVFSRFLHYSWTVPNLYSTFRIKTGTSKLSWTARLSWFGSVKSRDSRAIINKDRTCETMQRSVEGKKR